MKPKQYIVRPILQLAASDRRGVAFLVCSADGGIDAVDTFEGLNKDKEREVRTRFDYWIGGGINPKYFHGFDGEYRDVFVFKYALKNVNQRFYGFLINPMPISNKRFQVCVLASHTTKTEWESDKTEKDHMKGFSGNRDVQKAAGIAYPEKKA